MGVHGCKNCKNLKCYPGDYWTPDEYECDTGPATEELLVRVWENGETWTDDEEPLCDEYEELKEEW